MLYLPLETVNDGYEYEKHGFRLGKETYFGYKVEALPDGWKLIGGSKFGYYLVDNLNRIRGVVNSEEDDDTLQMFTRYDIGYRVTDTNEPFVMEIITLDILENHVIRTFGTYVMDVDSRSEYERMVREAFQSLTENFEDWRNPFAYWTEESFGGRFRFVPIYDKPRG